MAVAPSFHALFASTDFSQYWCAAKLVLAGQNPYSSELIYSCEKTALPFLPEAIRLWNPPFVLPLLLPFAFFDFETAALLWSILSLVAGCSAWFLSLRLFQGIPTRGARFAASSFLALYYPLTLCLAYGQISAFLAFVWSVFLTLFCASPRTKTHAWSAGVVLSLTLIKPHLFLPLYLFLAYRSLYEQNFRRVLVGFGAGALTLLGAALTISSSLLFWYQQAWKDPPWNFKNPTLGSLLQEITGMGSALIRWSPFLVGVVILLIILIRTARVHPIHHLKSFLLLSPFSLLIAPYGWVYDQLLLLPSLAFLFSVSTKNPANHLPLFLLLALLQLSWYLVPSSWGQEWFIFVPLLVGLSVLLTPSKEPNATTPT